MKGRNMLGALLTCLMLILAALPLHAAQAATPVQRQGTYYLALGDSLTAGYQPDASIPWSRGWTYQFRDMLAKRAPIELTNLALGGECTGTFIKGGLSPACATKAFTSPSQLAEAVAYLTHYRNRVNPITVDIGGDNMNNIKVAFLQATPAKQQEMAQKLFTQLARDWTVIYRTLRGACPTCTIIAVNQYNPYPSSAPGAATVAKIMAAYDSLLRKVTAPFGVKVADVCSAFVGHELEYTWVARGDIHATTAGYMVMANVVAKTSGLMR